MNGILQPFIMHAMVSLAVRQCDLHMSLTRHLGLWMLFAAHRQPPAPPPPLSLARPNILHVMSCHTLLCWFTCMGVTWLLVMLQAELHGIIPANGGKFEGLQQSAMRWSNRLRQAAGVCHSITMVHKTVLAREPMERSMFKLVEAQFLVRMLTTLTMQKRHRRRNERRCTHK